MCGRVDRPSGKEAFKELHKNVAQNIRLKEDFEEHRNVAPTLGIPIITQKEPECLQLAYWGLVPFYAKEFKMQYSTFNATSENLFTGTTWKSLVGKKHCVIVVRGFYEWQYDDPEKKKGKHIFRIQTAGSALTYMAGMYEDWVDKSTGEVKQSCTIITNPANTLMANIHNTKARMPAFLDPKQVMDWVNPEIELELRMKLISPVNNDFLITREIAEII